MHMDTVPQQAIQQRFGELPEDVKKAVQSAEVQKSIQSIGAAKGLHIDQMGALEDETLMVMLGFVEPAQFPARLVENLHISKETAQGIVDDLSQQVFQPIRESMRAFMESKETKVPMPDTRPPAAASVPTPTLHPVDAVLAQPVVAVAKTLDVGIAPATKTPASSGSAAPQAPVAKQYAADPYQEPI